MKKKYYFHRFDGLDFEYIFWSYDKEPLRSYTAGPFRSFKACAKDAKDLARSYSNHIEASYWTIEAYREQDAVAD